MVPLCAKGSHMFLLQFCGNSSLNVNDSTLVEDSVDGESFQGTLSVSSIVRTLDWVIFSFFNVFSNGSTSMYAVNVALAKYFLNDRLLTLPSNKIKYVLVGDNQIVQGFFQAFCITGKQC